jgi:PAS domain S-box-containing protein
MIRKLKSAPPEDEAKEKARTEEWLELAVKSASLGVWSWDLNPHTTQIVRSEQYDKILGIEPGIIPWTREDLLKMIHPEDRPRMEASVQSVLSGAQETYNSEYRVIRKDGTIRWVHAFGKGIADSKGKLVRLTGVVHDVTDRKKLERDREQFIETLSHDLRNPLATARANAELLLKYHDRIQDREGLLTRIILSTERADGLIQDLLDTSRIRTGRRIHLVMEACDLKAVLFETVEDLTSVHGDRFKLNAEGDFQGLWCSGGIRRVVENLAENAIKYGAPDTPVTITLGRQGNRVSLSVHNQGNPIPKEEQQTLFEPFRRAASAEAGTTQGWGLGLTLVKAIAEALGGELSVESDERTGTTFRLDFPAKTDNLLSLKS